MAPGAAAVASGGPVYRAASDTAVVSPNRLKSASSLPRPSLLRRVGNHSAVKTTDLARCECCGLGEECTLGYVASVKQRYCGHFMCGLCAEAVKEEQVRLERRRGGADMEEAVQAHMGVCKQFNCGVRENPLAAAASAMGQLLLRRSLEPRGPDARGPLSRTSSCMVFK